jgi:predicted PurR-regulated permease PerM
MKSAIMPFFIGSATAYISYPIFKKLETVLKNRVISAVLTLSTICVLIAAVILIVLPTIVVEIESFFNYLPKLMEKIDVFLYKQLGEHFFEKLNFNITTFERIIKTIYLQIGQLPVGDIFQRLFSGFFSVFGIMLNIILVPLITYYFLVNASKIKELYLKIAPQEIREELGELLEKVHSALSNYLSGQFLVATFVGIYLSLGLYLVGIRYAFLIGFISGVLNMIPYVGFFSGLIPSILLAIFDNGELKYVVGVLIVFLTEVGIENLIYPIVMSKTTGINPLVVLLSILVGGYYGGILGIIIAVPVAVMIIPVFENFLRKKENG